MTPMLINFLSSDSTLVVITEVMLFFIVLVSFLIFIVMATFRGKSVLDWFLQYRELAIVFVAGHIFLQLATDFETSPIIRVVIYSTMALVCLGVLVSLIREHAFYEGAPSIRERWNRFRE